MDNIQKLARFHPLQVKTFIKEQFHKKLFFFDCEEPTFIASAQCGAWQPAYIGIRLLVLAFNSYQLIIEALRYNGDIPFLAYQLNWFLIVRVMSSVAILLSSIHLFMVGGQLTGTPMLYKVTWILYLASSHITANIQTFVYVDKFLGSKYRLKSETATISYLIDKFTALINFLTIGIPINLLHFYIGTIAALVYRLFSLTYWLAGGGIIYEISDWDSNGVVAAGWFVFGLILSVVNQLSFFVLYWLRLLLHKYVFFLCCYQERRQVITDCAFPYRTTDVIPEEPEEEEDNYEKNRSKSYITINEVTPKSNST